MDPWTPLGKEDSAAWEEKRVPPGVSPWGCCLQAWQGGEADPSTPFPFYPGPLFAWSSRGRGWGQGRLLRGADLLGPHQKGVGVGRVSLSDFAGESWRRA